MPSKFLIYALTDPRTDEVRYIGKSCSGLHRPCRHTSPSELAKDFTYKGNWIRQLKASGLRPKIEVVEEFSSGESLAEYEVFWISQFRALGFNLTNLTDGGDGAPGSKRSEKTRLADSERRRLYWQSDKGQARLKSIKGKSRSKELVEATANYHRGRKETIESRIKMSIGKGGRPIVNQFGQIYQTQVFAAEALGLRASNINQVLKGSKKHTHGYIFKYVE